MRSDSLKDVTQVSFRVEAIEHAPELVAGMDRNTQRGVFIFMFTWQNAERLIASAQKTEIKRTVK